MTNWVLLTSFIDHTQLVGDLFKYSGSLHRKSMWAKPVAPANGLAENCARCRVTQFIFYFSELLKEWQKLTEFTLRFLMNPWQSTFSRSNQNLIWDTREVFTTPESPHDSTSRAVWECRVHLVLFVLLLAQIRLYRISRTCAEPSKSWPNNLNGLGFPQ